MRRSRSKVSSIAYIVVGMIALMLGIAILVVPSLLGPMDLSMRVFFIGMLFIYGIYRLYTGLSDMKQHSKDVKI
jgi:hypothetical protein